MTGSNDVEASQPTAGTLRIEGPDAVAFAHAQFTSDVASLETGHWQWSAWLDARGRVRNLFHLLRLEPDRLVAILRGGDGEAMAQALRPSVFRSRASITALPPQHIAAGTALPFGTVHSESGTLHIGFSERSLSLPSPDTGGSDLEWRLQAIRHGEPWLPADLAGTLLPPALGLYRLGAIKLDKGCYPGQEIVARLHYRGGHKHLLAHMRLTAWIAPGSSPPAPAHDTASGIATSMQVLDCVPVDDAYEALAVVHESSLDALRQADAPMQVLHAFTP